MPSLKPNGRRLNGRGSGWLPKAVRLGIYLRDRFHCLYCGRDLHAADPRQVTLDHLRPRCQGGSHAPSNLVTACATCNFTRQNRSWKRFIRDTWDWSGGTGPQVAESLIKHIQRQSRRAPRLKLAHAILAGHVSRAEVIR